MDWYNIASKPYEVPGYSITSFDFNKISNYTFFGQKFVSKNTFARGTSRPKICSRAELRVQTYFRGRTFACKNIIAGGDSRPRAFSRVEIRAQEYFRGWKFAFKNIFVDENSRLRIFSRAEIRF